MDNLVHTSVTIGIVQTAERRKQGRGSHGHFLGFWARLNCENMPVIKHTVAQPRKPQLLLPDRVLMILAVRRIRPFKRLALSRVTRSLRSKTCSLRTTESL
jgi:hypothetical protein